jgi:F0F1-type ATP synthase assembly protein I
MATVGLEVALSILFGLLGGQWLDARFGTEPWLMGFGLFFGVGAAARFLYRASKRGERALANDDFEKSSVGRSARFAMDQKLDRLDRRRSRKRAKS